MNTIVALAASKKYTDDTADRLGSLKGAPCTIKSITNIEGGKRITFSWTGTSGTEQTSTMDVMDGADGQDAQKSSLPTASVDELGNIYQYVGATTADYTKGFFYQCIQSGGSYVWSQIPVQDGGGGGGDVTGVKGAAESTYRKGNVSISAANIGLDKVNNTSDLNKPVSTPQQAALDLKVDKVEGKGLSTNDYTNDDKAIVDGVETELAKKVNKVTGKGLSTNDYTNDDKAIVDGVTAALAGKVDKVQGKGLSTNDYTDTDKAEVAKVADKADKTDVIDGASYDSTNHLILFKNGSTTLFSLDAAAFVKDGMVDTVEITGGNLVITFNTDAGKQAISIPLTDIFDPSNYYNKTATDNLLADKTDKVSGATNGNFAGLDSNGNLTDSGKKAADFQPVIPEAFTGDLNTLSARGFHQYTAAYADLSNAPTVSYTVNRCYIDVWSDGAGNVCQIIKLVGLTYDPATKYCDIFKRSCYSTGSALSWGAWEKQNGKTDLITSPTNNNLVAMDANGNIKDSGKKASDFATPENVQDSINTSADLLKDTVGWTGKNLIVNGGARTRTVNGVTFVVNQDGSVTCNGTATGNYANFVMLSRVDNVVILKSGTYILSGCPSGGGQGKYQLVAQATRNGELYSYGEDWGDGKTITAEDGDSLQIVVNITGGQTVDNITFYPMLRRADILDGTYEPYHESVEAMYEEKAEQEEVNDIVNALGAKNILNPSWLYNNSAITITPAYDVYGNLKKYTLDGTATGDQVSILLARRAAKTLTLEAGTSWIFSIGNTLPSGGSMQVGYTHPTTGEWTLLKSQRADNLAFTVPGEAEGMYWTIQIIVKDLTFDGYDIFPMLRPSFIEDDTYAPFARANRDLTREIEAMPQELFTTPHTLLSTTNDADDFQCGFTRCSNANANLPTTGSGSSVLWYDVLTIRQANDPSSELWGYGFQLAIQTTTTATQSDTYVRAVNGGATPVWGAWKKLTT